MDSALLLAASIVAAFRLRGAGVPLEVTRSIVGHMSNDMVLR